MNGQMEAKSASPSEAEGSHLKLQGKEFITDQVLFCIPVSYFQFTGLYNNSKAMKSTEPP